MKDSKEEKITEAIEAILQDPPEEMTKEMMKAVPDGRGGFLVTNRKLAHMIEQAIGHQSPEAYVNGSVIRKVNSGPKDRTKDGTLGTVKGSFGKRGVIEGVVCVYIIKWHNDDPAEGTLTASNKVELVVP